MTFFQQLRRLWPLPPLTREARLGHASRRRSLTLEMLEDRCLPSTGLPFLVKDINPDTPGSNPVQITAVNGKTFFAADDGVNGAELWMSDGTEGGTVMLKDIATGSAGSSPFNLTIVNGRLFFEANYVFFQGSELWTSDGTPEGTIRLKTRSFGNLTDVNGTLFFTADYGLWKSDGTVGGTVHVTTNVPLYTAPTGLTNVNGTLFFAADGGKGVELWKSDGTDKGTVQVKDINNSSTSETYIYRGHRYHYRIYNSSNPSGLTNVNGTLYFTADNGSSGRELWKSDGSSAGTKLVKDINPNGSSNPFGMTNVNGAVFFTASDGTNGFELWKTDGTAKGTLLVRDIASGSASSTPNNLTSMNGALFFTADDGASGRELWKSDGTSAGTVLVKDIQSGVAGSGASGLKNVNGTLYFAADEGATGMELWRSDGTPGGTSLVADINPGIAGSSPAGLTVAGAQFYFSADDGVHGRELWDPPAGDTTLLASGLEGAQGSAVGPGNDLYVTESVLGRITRIDSKTGETTTFASGLPISPFAGFGGGAIDVAFLGQTAYVLVTGVGSDVGGDDVVGIYRVDGPTSFTVIADIGTWSIDHPPATDFELPTGYQYALQPYRGGFLVTDGHHNRVLHVELNGAITEAATFGNIVPTGLAVRGNTVYLAEAGPIPHLPADGKVVAFGAQTPLTTVAAGAPLLVDVEFGPGNTLYALAQGDWDSVFPGDPALPNTGSFVRVKEDGTFFVIEEGLDQPTSLEFIGTTAYVVTLTGDVLRIDGATAPAAASAGTLPSGDWYAVVEALAAERGKRKA